MSSSVQRAAGRPPGDTGESTRVEILDAALDAFAEVGFEAMSVRQLTRRLGVSHNLVHHHFGSKDDLWRAVLDHGAGATVADLMERIGGSVGAPGAAATLRDGIERAMALLRRRPAVARIVVDESARPGPRLDYVYERYLGPMVELLTRFLAASTERGLRDVDPRVATLFLVSGAAAPFAHGALADKLGVGSTYSDASIDLMLGGLLADD